MPYDGKNDAEYDAGNKLDFRILSLSFNKFHIHSARFALFNISLKQDNMMKIFSFNGHFTLEIDSYFKNLISSKWVFPFDIGRINFIYFSIYFLNTITL